MAFQHKFRIHDLFQGVADRLHLNENTVTLILASLIGIIGGYGAVGFRALIEFIQTVALGGSEHVLDTVSALPWYQKIWIPTLGGLIVGPLIYFLGKETKGHGVPEVMEAVALRGAKIRVRVMLLKAFVSAVTIGTGGSVGREGPIVQIGSSMGSSFGQLLRVSKERMRVLVACGAAAGIAATFNAPIAGVLFAIEIIMGNYAISRVLKTETVWFLLLMLLPIKMLATSITLAAGGSGGIFAPCLFLGAVFGGLFGIMMQFLFPATVLSPGAYAVVGMSAMVAGATHAPLTAFMVIFEMTGDYKLILPLMLCAILASFVATLTMKDSIYTMKLSRRGVDLSKGMEVSIMQATKVRDVMKQEMVVLNDKAGFNDILQSVINSHDSYYYVVDDNNVFQGSFNVHDIKEVLTEQSLSGLVVAEDLVALSVSPFIEMEATLAECMRKFSIYETEELPVVENSNTLRLMGKISRQYLINFYNREILRQGSLGLKFIQGKLPTTVPTQSYIDLPDDFEIHVLPVAAGIQGQTLKDLDIRNAYGVSVVSINRIADRGERAVIIPNPDEALQKGDMLILIGKREDLNRLKTAFNYDSHSLYFHSTA